MTDGTPGAPLTMGVDRAVATLTFDRPQKSNAYDKAMQRTLGACFTQAAADMAIRVLVLRGEGKHFCAGADLSPAARSDDAEAPGIAELCQRLSTLPKPTLALVQGACLGGGMALVACCDIVIATEDAFFAMPEARLGFSPTPLIPFLLQALGAREARRVLMAGARVGAGEALRIGLVQAVGKRPDAEQMLDELIGELLQSAPGAITTIKAAVARLRHQPVTPELLTELQRGFDANNDTAESQECRAAAREKRPPNWAVKR
jgi:methylglutaconyl-CoA hydratase